MSLWERISREAKLSGQSSHWSGYRQGERRQTMVLSPAYQPGLKGSTTAFVLAAPGQAEERAGRPAAGDTGVTLNRVLSILHTRMPDQFRSQSKDDYVIVNAVPDIHYEALTGRTEGKRSDVCQPENVERLNHALAGMKLVIPLGKSAQRAVGASNYTGAVMSGSHPSKQNINRNIKAVGEDPGKRSTMRITGYTDLLIASFRKGQSGSR